MGRILGVILKCGLIIEILIFTYTSISCLGPRKVYVHKRKAQLEGAEIEIILKSVFPMYYRENNESLFT